MILLLVAVVLAGTPRGAFAHIELPLAVQDTLGGRRDSVVDLSRAPDSVAARRIVRQFPPITVRAPLHDMRSSETVQIVSTREARTLPVSGLTDLIGLKAGVVARAGELHVRGGRSGEVALELDGIRLNEPFRERPMELPLSGLRSADVITGAPDAEFGAALAGVVNALTVNPGDHYEGEAQWQSGGDFSPRFDRGAARVSGPLGLFGLGWMASGEATLDDPWYLSLRSANRTHLLGGSFGWRTDNRMLGLFKLTPVGERKPFALEVLVNRVVERPYDAMWSLDGWTTPAVFPTPAGFGPAYSPTPVSGFDRYRAADHYAMTDDRRLAAVLTVKRETVRDRWSGALGWVHGRRLTSVGGSDDESYLSKDRGPVFGLPDQTINDPFHVYFGDEPYYRREITDALGARADWERFAERGLSVKIGGGASAEHAELREIDASTWGLGIDSLRAFNARAPSAFGYGQLRWRFEGLVLNAGLRADYFTAGAAAEASTYGGRASGSWSTSPRLGVAYPISTRDVFSLAYVRINQPPSRDFLYDSRRRINQLRPLGNPFLATSTVISYQAALKHLFNDVWSAQASVFYRDLFGQIGAREEALPLAAVTMRYENADDGHFQGFELSLLAARDPGARAEIHYTWLDAQGTESGEEGLRYYATTGLRPTPIGDHALDWDQRHTLAFLAAVDLRGGWQLGWTTVAGSGFPWTPAILNQPPADLSQLNSRRLGWGETSAARVQWAAPWLGRRMRFGAEVLNVFDSRHETAATLGGYPNPVINTLYDDYGAFRTLTGRPGGAYWNDKDGDGKPGWIYVRDPRLFAPPRAARLTVGTTW